MIQAGDILVWGWGGVGDWVGVSGWGGDQNYKKYIPLKFFTKKINLEIWSQKYPLGSSSWRPFFQKLSPRGCF